jgi:hypothetical protein
MPAPQPVVRGFTYTDPLRGTIQGTAVLLENTLSIVTDDGEAFQAQLGPMPKWVRLAFSFSSRRFLPTYWIADASQLPTQQRSQWVHFKLVSELLKITAWGSTDVVAIAQDWLVGLGIPRPAGDNFNPTPVRS